MTMNETMQKEISALFRSRHPLLWVVSAEEARAERSIVEAAAAATYEVKIWDCIAGVTDATGKEVPPGAGTTDPGQVLAAIRNIKERAVWILKDLPHRWLDDPTVRRAVRNLARTLPATPRAEARAIVILTTDPNVPPELADHAVVIKWGLPDRTEVGRIFDSVLEGLPADRRAKAAPDGVREAAIESAMGLSAERIAGIFAKSLVTQDAKIVPTAIATGKKQLISDSKGIDWFDPDPRGLAGVAGLEKLKDWLMLRKSAFSQKAREFGLPWPKGVLILGPPGTGKSLTAKCISTAWQMPLLKFDLNGMKSKWVGESEETIRKTLDVIDAIGNCILWVDEIEKALAGATSGGADGGVSTDALGVLLNWMQERKGGAFVIATANDVSKLPPELLRKGRFDEIWFVDLPTPSEREEILRVTLKRFDREKNPVNVAEVAEACPNFTGAEIASLVEEALFTAFADGERELQTKDLIAAAKVVVPLATTAAETIKALRAWADQGRARPACAKEAVKAAPVATRTLDV